MGFSIKSAIQFGWETFKKRPWLFVGAFLLFVIAQGLLKGLSEANEDLFPSTDEDPSFIGAVINLAIYFGLGTLVSMGITAFSLAGHDRPETVQLSALWHPHPFGKYLGLSILFALLTLGLLVLGFVLVVALGLETGLAIGIPLVVVLGTILFLMFVFSGFLVIDRTLGPITAMKESYRITQGFRWRLLGLSLLLLLINLLGFLAFFVGMLVSGPVALLAITRAYRVLSGTTGAPPDQAMDAKLAA